MRTAPRLCLPLKPYWAYLTMVTMRVRAAIPPNVARMMSSVNFSEAVPKKATISKPQTATKARKARMPRIPNRK